MDKYQRLLRRKYLEVLEGVQDVKELKEAVAILCEIRALENPQRQSEETSGGGIVELG